jgi:type IV fimbrial biogenesis protein FimT
VCADTIDWSGGWLVYADLDGDRAHDPYETTVGRQRRLSGGVRVRSTSGRRQLIFQPSGGNAGSNVTFTLCDSRGWSAATTLVLSNGGNLRQGKPTAAAAQACGAGS